MAMNFHRPEPGRIREPHSVLRLQSPRLVAPSSASPSAAEPFKPLSVWTDKWPANSEQTAMLEWILILLIVAAVASMIGMPRLAGASATAAQLLVFVVLGAMLLYLVVGLFAVA